MLYHFGTWQQVITESDKLPVFPFCQPLKHLLLRLVDDRLDLEFDRWVQELVHQDGIASRKAVGEIPRKHRLHLIKVFPTLEGHVIVRFLGKKGVN